MFYSFWHLFRIVKWITNGASGGNIRSEFQVSPLISCLQIGIYPLGRRGKGFQRVSEGPAVTASSPTFIDLIKRDLRIHYVSSPIIFLQSILQKRGTIISFEKWRVWCIEIKCKNYKMGKKNTLEVVYLNE